MHTALHYCKKCGLVTWRIACIFYLSSTLLCFFLQQITLVRDVGAESSLKASRIIELNISHKLLCCMVSQASQVLQT